ncbi:MAG: bifunctional riboflavin kinase/FAD synthetase [Solirubrobacteraceae bacterium]|nr:bifunctional riboflavin kinase/FAD synthetase [Solirubrobacteraceae bacterium]
MSARITPLADVLPRPRTVAVGMFDGVHLGHREVIRGADTALTLHPHPLAVLRPDRVPAQLTTLERKAALIGALGVQELVLVPFDAQTAAQSPQEFVDDVLVRRLDARGVRVGENFHFGHGAAGTPTLLASDPRFDTVIVPLLSGEGQRLSSTRARELVAAGDVAAATRILGDPFALSGIVEPGERRGRELGFPTANLEPPPGHALPAHGVYACRARIDGDEARAAAVSIGVRPQFESALGVLVEAHVVDWSGDLYGRPLELEFLERLRGEERFDDVPSLVAQIRRDVEATRRVFRAHA